ncbi:MAG: BNR-4 repeat-containing protein [Thermoanaerobaculia bacterium]
MVKPTAAATALVLLLGKPVFAGADEPTGFERIDVAPVWSGHPVNFAIETSGGWQYVAFYDPARRMTVAQRRLDSVEWTFSTLPSTVGWDSHNYLVLAVDRAGFVHVSGNMHGDRLVYFRSKAPHDVSAFDRPGMVGGLEREVTYPSFVRDVEERLLFHYRDGISGNGAQIVNAFDEERQAWVRLLAEPLFDGGGKMSAYLAGPTRGPDGLFHLAWMWRDSPMGDTNHDLSYARSRDLVSWEAADGVPVELPIRPDTAGVVVDPVRSGGGLAGIAFGVGWDSRQRTIVTYSKYDAAGRSQSYNARFERQWLVHRVSDWDFRWELARTGTLPEDIVVRPPAIDPQGRLTQEFRHVSQGTGTWILNEESMRVVDVEPIEGRLRELRTPNSETPGMEVREFIRDRRGEYFLRWETLTINRDRPRKKPYPEPTMLSVLRERPDSDETAPLEPHPRPEEFAAGQSRFALIPATLEGARIGQISVNVGDIFDESDPSENRRVFRLVNRLRRRTGDRVIRNELLFEKGDLYSHRLIQESERLLRKKSYLYEAEIRAVDYSDDDGDGIGEVDLEVNTRDVWTLGGGVSLSRSGGENMTRFEIDDSNFLGTGTELQLSHATDVERTTTEIKYRNHNLFGKRGQFELGLQHNSDGHRRLFRLGLPFYALDSRRSKSITVVSEERVDPLFDRGQLTSEFGHEIDLLDAHWGFSRGLNDGVAKRWFLGYTVLRDRFTSLVGRPPAAELPGDRNLSYVWVGLDRIEDRFVKSRDLDRIARTEDINLGTAISGRFGLSSTAIGADRNQALVGLDASTGFQPGSGQHLLFLSGTGGTRWSGQGFENAAISGSARLFRRNRGGRVFYAELQAAAVENLNADEQLLIGGDSGLRGYPLRFQQGDRRLLLTLEQRFYTDREIFKLATLGAAVFVDAGRAWFTGGHELQDLGVLTDVGFGLRLNPTRSGRNNVLHLDVAFPLSGGAGVDSVQFLVAAKESL